MQPTAVQSSTEVNLRTRLDCDGFYLARRIPPSSTAQPVDSKGNPLLPLMTVFPTPRFPASRFQRAVAHAAHAQVQQWIPIPFAQPGHTHIENAPPTTPPGHTNGQPQQEPPVIPLLPSEGVDPGCVLQVRSQGKRGVPLSEIDVRWAEEMPNEQGTVYRDGFVQLDKIRAVVDAPDWCVCHLVPGPTIRIAAIGAEWPGTFVEQPGYPARKQARAEGGKEECFTFGMLCQLVVEHFLTWWTNEQERRAERMRASENSLEQFPFVPGPGMIPLKKLILVAIRRRHIALGVYEWLPEIEVAL
ncbi:hypothetical protein GSI_09384 [Ganoderma sinense ZZ0214-1]|uniref:Uncharacterized protein n=1 Tax=Ganoderma sinense ZZ0214-1 TaxID=1077348 RepID=A0A2G8S6D9_9APHY|nr:hypothetical protein GSI_09384 [Ganoderma sinense ZZ0214-1]